MSEFAIVCPDATMIIAPAINITVAVSAAPAKIALIVFGFRMVDLLTIAPINPTFPQVNCGTAWTLAGGGVPEKR